MLRQMEIGVRVASCREEWRQRERPPGTSGPTLQAVCIYGQPKMSCPQALPEVTCTEETPPSLSPRAGGCKAQDLGLNFPWFEAIGHIA